MHLYRHIPIWQDRHIETKERRMAGWGMTSESQIRAQAKYDAEHTTRICLKLNTRTDRDIICWLWRQKSKQGAIKKLIREDIAKMEMAIRAQEASHESLL